MIFTKISLIPRAAFVRALNNSDRRFIPGGTTYEVEVGGLISAGIRPEQLITADLEAWKVEHEAEDIKPIGVDPFVHCPVCATSTRETLDDGEGRVF